MMFLSNRDIRWAIKQKLLVVRPSPEESDSGYDETSIDLHLDDIELGARVWDINKFKDEYSASGYTAPELILGDFKYNQFATKYLKKIPEGPDDWNPVFKRGNHVIVKPQGFLLWTTKEWVGTPATNPQYICFVDAKSTKARIGVVVHLSAPNIHAGWEGNITLEIVNFGPFHVILKPGDAIAQLTVSVISSAPDPELKKTASVTANQNNPAGTSAG